MQNNVHPGEIVFNAKTDLQGKEGLLVKIKNDSNKATVSLPEAATDQVLFVITDTQKGAGAETSVLPLSIGQNVRVRLKGTCVPGDVLVLASPDGTDDGKVTALPETAGNYRQVGIAEEKGVDGQLVLLRPVNDLVTVTE